MMNGRGEVRLRRSSEETCEQHRGIGCGVGGAKDGDQGEHGSVQHVSGFDARVGRNVSLPRRCPGIP